MIVIIELEIHLNITWYKGIEKKMRTVKIRCILWKKKCLSVIKIKTKVKTNTPERI